MLSIMYILDVYCSSLMFVLYDIYVAIICIYSDYCVYNYTSADLVYLYTLDIGL